jgi:BMFP domain-containing protein YqiC
MRKRIESTALAALLTYAGMVFGQTGPGKEEKPANPPADKPAKTIEQMSLDELLALALKNNPDLRVADAKVREAEAELNRARLQVTQKVVNARNAIKSQEANVAAAATGVQRAKQMSDKAVISREEVNAAQLVLVREKAKLTELEAELPYLIGKAPQEGGKDSVRDAAYRAFSQYFATSIFVNDQLAATAAQQHFNAPRGTDAEKLRKALGKPINLRFEKSNLKDVLAEMGDNQGVSFLVNINVKDLPEITLNLKDTSLGGALQALEDITPGLRFTVRDYGILVTYKTQLPADAMSVHDFLKSEAGKEKPKGEAGKPEESTPNVPPGKVDGKVKQVDANGLVLIDLGSDDGLAKGHNLEAFRLDPQPRYLGTLRIVQVRLKEAVGQPVRKLNDAIKEGDRVSNQVFVK